MVDMCERGELSFVWVGSHRRLRRADVDEFLGRQLTRDQERSLWLHRIGAGKLGIDPAGGVGRAPENLTRLREIHPRGVAARYLAEWQLLLAGNLDDTLDLLTSRSPRAIELRQNSPFSGVLPEDERQACLAAFRVHWQREHAA